MKITTKCYAREYYGQILVNLLGLGKPISLVSIFPESGPITSFLATKPFGEEEACEIVGDDFQVLDTKDRKLGRKAHLIFLPADIKAEETTFPGTVMFEEAPMNFRGDVISVIALR